MFSKALVISAESNFETSSPKKNKNTKKYPYFSKEYREAHSNHKNVCSEWRKAGRPKDFLHPAKANVLYSRRNLQQISRYEDSSNSINLHNDLMDTFATDVNKIYPKLKKARGENNSNIEIPFIDTLAGRYDGSNILEGFCANTEILCNENETDNKHFDNEFYKMSILDNLIIFEITANEDLKIPHMNLNQLKDIIFKKLKLKKACDVYKLTVEHLRYAGD